MQSRAYNNFKIRERSITARRRINETGRESGGNGQNLNKDTRHECRDSQDTHITRTDKKHSDQIHLDISMAQSNDIETIKERTSYNVRGFKGG